MATTYHYPCFVCLNATPRIVSLTQPYPIPPKAKQDAVPICLDCAEGWQLAVTTTAFTLEAAETFRPARRKRGR